MAFFGVQVISIDKKCSRKIVVSFSTIYFLALDIQEGTLTSRKRPRTECIRRGRKRSFVSAFYHPMQQIKLKGFSSWGGKNAQHCRYSTRVAEMLQKKLHGFFPVLPYL